MKQKGLTLHQKKKSIEDRLKNLYNEYTLITEQVDKWGLGLSDEEQQELNELLGGFPSEEKNSDGKPKRIKKKDIKLLEKFNTAQKERIESTKEYIELEEKAMDLNGKNLSLLLKIKRAKRDINKIDAKTNEKKSQKGNKQIKKSVNISNLWQFGTFFVLLVTLGVGFQQYYFGDQEFGIGFIVFSIVVLATTTFKIKYGELEISGQNRIN